MPAQLSVTAEFAVAPDHPAARLLAQQDMEPGDSLVLRRVVGADGRSRAFVNDQPVSVGLLRQLGEALVEIHGQFESHGLLDPATHRIVLDAFGDLDTDRARQAWTAWRAARARPDGRGRLLARPAAKRITSRHAVVELTALDPAPARKAALAANGRACMHRRKAARRIERGEPAPQPQRRGGGQPADRPAALGAGGRKGRRPA